MNEGILFRVCELYSLMLYGFWTKKDPAFPEIGRIRGTIGCWMILVVQEHCNVRIKPLGWCSRLVIRVGKERCFQSWFLRRRHVAVSAMILPLPSSGRLGVVQVHREDVIFAEVILRGGGDSRQQEIGLEKWWLGSKMVLGWRSFDRFYIASISKESSVENWLV